jgi:hypothetical protein
MGAPRVSEPRGSGGEIPRTPDRFRGIFPPDNRRSFSIEYPANGSFFRPHTRSVPRRINASRTGYANIRRALVLNINGQATKGVR